MDWISVYFMSPPPYEKVLCCTKHKVLIAYYSPMFQRWYEGHMDIVTDAITHWKLLPNLPK